MKQFIYILLSVSLLVACENETQKEERILLGFTPRELPNFKAEAKLQKMVVTTNQSSWDYVLEDGGEWITVSRDADTLFIETQTNETLKSRAARLVVTIGKGENQLIRYFPIKQLSLYSFAFDIADLDAEGWLWFDTQEKIDKYVGADKLIQIYGATHGTFEQTQADATIVGADDAGTAFDETDASENPIEQNGTQKTGAIRLALASGVTSQLNGGSIEIALKDCNEFALSLSSNSSMQPGLYLSTNNGVSFEPIKIYAGAFFGTLAPAGQTIWKCHTEKQNALTHLDSEKDNIVRILNIKSRYLDIHGIKLLY